MVRTQDKLENRGRRSAGAGLAAILVCLAAGVGPARAADDPILTKLVGDWIGRGKARTTPTAAEELVYCKIANRLVDGGRALEQKGRCAVATNSGTVKGKIIAAGNGRYEGTLESFSTNGVATLAGSGKTDTIVLTASFTDRATKKPNQSKITLVTGSGKYRLVSETLDANGNTGVRTGDILFDKN